MNEDEQKEMLELIPENRGGMQRIADLIYWRNFVEAVITTGILIAIIVLIPFLKNMKIFSIMFFPSLNFLLFSVGIKHKSVTQYIILWLKYKASKKSLRLRSPADEDSTTFYESNETLNKYTEKAKEYFSDSNLDKEDGDIKRILAKGLKQFVTNLKDGLGI